MMELKKVKTEHEGSQYLYTRIQKALKENPKLVLGLITGSTPIQTYELFSKNHQENDWSEATTFNLDEYVGLNPNNENSYHYFMHQHLFNSINIKPENIYIPQVIGNIEENIKNYELALSRNQIDIQLLGLGENGHIGFNEPFSSIDDGMRIVDLTSETIDANQRFFENKDQVPTKAVTMGIKNILEAKSIIVVAFGAKKSEAIKHLIEGEVNPQWPCTYLKKHHNVLVIADEAACASLKD